jgi:IMP dehydrogenase
MFNPTPSYSYSDIGIRPLNCSQIFSRKEVDTFSLFLNRNLSLPIISAPMVTVSGDLLSKTLNSLGGLCFLPRTRNAVEDMELFKKNHYAIPSMPATGDWYDRLEVLSQLNAEVVCIDVANGFHTLIESVVHTIHIHFPKFKIVTGNVASLEGYKFLADLGVDAVRVGVGNGSACKTSVKTAIGVGQASLVREIAEFKYESECCGQLNLPLIIADGGIQNTADAVKAIALGADVVMLGKMFGACTESAGSLVKSNNKPMKIFAGQASELIKQDNVNIEGDTLFVPCRGSVRDLWHEFDEAFRSAMAYLNCRTLEDLKYLDDRHFVYLMDGAKSERLVQYGA